MTWANIISSISFINRMNCKSLLITGGEPTEHPDFMNVVKFICQNTLNVIQIVIASNGIYFENNPSILKEIIEFDNRIAIQITNDARYYPKRTNIRNEIYGLEQVMFCDTVEYMYPQGRALVNKYSYESKCSKCFNFISITKQIQTKSIAGTINKLESNFKFCTPQIDADGSLKPGESSLCKSFGSVHDSDSDLISNILQFRCQQCDFINEKLPVNYQRLINIK